MELKIKARDVYGRTLLYPACEKARILCEMLNKKTLSTEDLRYCEALGFAVKEITSLQRIVPLTFTRI